LGAHDDMALDAVPSSMAMLDECYAGVEGAGKYSVRQTCCIISILLPTIVVGGAFPCVETRVKG